mmetsp:Transcript_8941/g.16109  ORF Transcript_8941/g.16109 Transcript_8941/m.16109 type:complete len:282 (-) Transcript_8941:1775-2620(-)
MVNEIELSDGDDLDANASVSLKKRGVSVTKSVVAEEEAKKEKDGEENGIENDEEMVEKGKEEFEGIGRRPKRAAAQRATRRTSAIHHVDEKSEIESDGVSVDGNKRKNSKSESTGTGKRTTRKSVNESSDEDNDDEESSFGGDFNEENESSDGIHSDDEDDDEYEEQSKKKQKVSQDKKPLKSAPKRTKSTVKSKKSTTVTPRKSTFTPATTGTVSNTLNPNTRKRPLGMNRAVINKETTEISGVTPKPLVHNVGSSSTKPKIRVGLSRSALHNVKSLHKL